MAIPRSILPNSGNKQFDIVMANLNRELKNIENRTLEGLVRAAAHIRQETEKTPPLTPLDLGNLRASWFVVTSKGPATDPLNSSGEFKNRPFKKMQTPASKMKAEHQEMITAAKTQIAQYKDPAVIMGYSANYALWVHEMLGANFSRPHSGPKWLEAAIKNNRNKIVEIVGKYAKIS